MIFRLMFGFETLNTGQSTPDAFLKTHPSGHESGPGH